MRILAYPARDARQVRTGFGQWGPSSGFDCRAGVGDAFPLAADGHTNRPRSKRFESRRAIWPSCQIIFNEIDAPTPEHDQLA